MRLFFRRVNDDLVAPVRVQRLGRPAHCSNSATALPAGTRRSIIASDFRANACGRVPNGSGVTNDSSPKVNKGAASVDTPRRRGPSNLGQWPETRLWHLCRLITGRTAASLLSTLQRASGGHERARHAAAVRVKVARQITYVSTGRRLAPACSDQCLLDDFIRQESW